MSNESYRTIVVHGSAEPSTVITVTVDGQLCKDGIVENDSLFSFQTNVKKHGKVEVEITVVSGSITIGNVTATYPVLFNGITRGTITFEQPIVDPIVVVKGNLICTVKPNTVRVTDSFKYDHLMFNGPTEFRITTKRQVTENDNIDVGGHIRLGFINGIFENFEAYYNYNQLPNDFVTNDNDLNLLKEQLYGGVAQLGERLLCKQDVAGSIPVTSTK